MNTNIKIKTAYMHYDMKHNIYNMFIFIEFCSIGFCLQRISNDKNTFYTEGPLYLNNGNVLYIYEKIEDMNNSIYLLKKELHVKKIKITQKYSKYIKCFSCYSCNYFVYVLELAYLNEKENLQKYGIYYDFNIKVSKNDEYDENLQKCLAYNDKTIIKTSTDFINKVKSYVQSDYNDELIISNIEIIK